MKAAKIASLFVGLALTLPAVAQSTRPNAGGGQSEVAARITDRGPHSRVWSVESWETNDLGVVVARTNSFVELATGLHYADPATREWVESNPAFQITEDGYAVARRCQHQVIVSPTLNPEDGVVIDLQTPDGKRMRSGIVGLTLFDPESGQRLQIASLRDVVGTLVASNEIVWADAFEGLRADVRVRNERGEFHQDVLLRERLTDSQLRALGFSGATVRMEVWTEFQEASPPAILTAVVHREPNVTVRARMAEPDRVDQRLDFGSMRMDLGSGKAFAEPQSGDTTHVLKEWKVIEGRQFLIESSSLEELAPLLKPLPVKTAALDLGTSAAQLAVNQPLSARPKRLTGVGKPTIKIASAAGPKLPSPVVVLDYVLINQGLPGYTFKGDTTYYVSAAVTSSGVTIFEGGAVLKYAVNASLTLSSSATLDWRGADYRPVILTAKDADTVGQIIPGSTGSPVFGAYANPALKLIGSSPWSRWALSHFRIAHAQKAIIASGTSIFVTLRSGQLVNCASGLSGFGHGQVFLRNLLFANVQTAVESPAFADFYVEHTTFDGPTGFPATPGYLVTHDSINSPFSLNVTNCILARISSFDTLGTQGSLDGDHNGFWNNSDLPFGVAPITANQTPFQTVGAGSYYLKDDTSPPFRDAGTPLISSDLLQALTAKTTYPPQVVESAITEATVWSPLYPRDGDGLPDLGYHYEPLDWVVNAKNVSAALTLSGGVAVGTYGGGSSYGLGITSTGSLDSEGTPANPNWIVRYDTVQEQIASSWASSTAGSSVQISSGTPNVTATYTGWSAPAASSSLGNHFNNNFGGAATFTHCQFFGGRFTVDPGSVNLINCLWHRVYVTLRDLNGDPEWNLYNNLFYGGTLYYRAPGDNPTLRAYDNFFDRTGITRGSGSEYFTHDYNGYLSGQSRLTPSPGPHDVVVANLAYARGPRGDFYQAQTDLVNQGSRSAVDAGLDYFYTVLPDQTRDGSSGNGDPVDIGFHYYISDPPLAYCQDVVTGKGQEVTFTLTGFDPYGGQLTFTKETDPSYGTLPQFDGTTGSVTYHPNANFEGVDSFYFTASAWGQKSDWQLAAVYVGNPVLAGACRPQSILLHWTISPNLEGYVTDFQIKRRLAAGGAYVVIDTVDAGTSSYEDTSVQPGVSYCYVVTALLASACGGQPVESAPSNEVCLSTCSDPPCDQPTLSGWLFTDQGFIAGGQNGAFREYNDPTSVAASPWKFLNSGDTKCITSTNGLLIRMDFEDDYICAHYNTNIQYATAEAVITVGPGCSAHVNVNWCGKVEQHNTGYERMWLYMDGNQIGYAQSTQGPDQSDCAPMLPVNGSQTIVLQPGFHLLRIESDTVDAQFHVNAYYEFQVALQPN